MPFLLADDAADFVTGRLQDFGNTLLQPLHQQAVTQRLQDFGSGLLQSAQAPPVPQLYPDPTEVTQRLQDFGQNVLSSVSAAPQAAQILPQAPDAIQQPQGPDGLASGFSGDSVGAVAQSVRDLQQRAGGFAAPVSQSVQDLAGQARQAAQDRIAQMDPNGRWDAAMQTLRQRPEVSTSELSDILLPQSVVDFVSQQHELARQGYAQAGLDQGTIGQMLNADFNDPASVRRALMGVDPYEQIVEQGVPSIVRGVQERDPGAVVGGAVQTLLGAAPLVPAAGGAAGGAAPTGENLLRRVVPELPAADGAVVPSLQEQLNSLRAAARPEATAQGATAAWVRQNILRQAPTGESLPTGTFAQDIVGFGKGNLLSSPWTHVTNIGSQLAELAQQPLGATVSGRGGEALAGLGAVKDVIPEALARFKDTLASGISFYADPSKPIARTYSPFLRLLSGTDDFFRTVGEAMGRAQEAQRVLKEAGNPTDPRQIQQLIQSNADRILAAGDSVSRLSVFGEGPTTGLGKLLSNTKQDLLSSPDKRAQLAGGLLDALVPFSGIPDRIWSLAVLRAPGINEAQLVAKLGKAAVTRDVGAFQDAVAQHAVNSVVNTAIVANALGGNIAGPDDPEHPNAINLGGKWYDYSSWGPLAGQFAIPAALVESTRKTGNTPGAEPLDYANGWGNASIRAVMQLGYVDNLTNLLQRLGEGGGVGALGSTATQYLDRLVPASGLLNAFEQAFDQNMRDVSQGKPWEREMSRIPGLAGLLPEKINPMTGEPLPRTKIGQAFQPPDALTQEINRLNRMGYSLSVPTKYPTEVSANGMTASLKPAEARAVTQITGNLLGRLAQRMADPSYQNASDDRKARLVDAWLNAADQNRMSAAAQVLGRQELRSRLVAGRTVVGRLVNQGPSIQVLQPPNIEVNTNEGAWAMQRLNQLQDLLAQARRQGDQQQAAQIQDEIDRTQQQVLAQG